MFSDQYKKDNDNLKLSDDFLNRLKADMRKEQQRLQQLNNMDNKSVETTDSLDFDEHKQTEKHRKHTLPAASLAAMAAFAALAVIVVSPRFGSQKDKYSEENMMFSADLKTEESQMESDSKSDSYCDSENRETATEEPKMTESYESAAADFCTTTFEEYTPDCINFNDKAEFNITDSDSLASLSMEFSAKEQGADPVTLDYAYAGRLICHDYYGMIVYDYLNQSIQRIVDLPSLIGPYTTQGDTALNVQVFQGGDYVLMDSNSRNESDQPVCYIYDIQTDRIISITKSQYKTLKKPAFDKHITDDTSFFGDLLTSNHSLDSAKTEPNEQIILYYEDPDSTDISSLSVLIKNSKQSQNMRIFPKEEAN